jgi:hypothetical protein
VSSEANVDYEIHYSYVPSDWRPHALRFLENGRVTRQTRFEYPPGRGWRTPLFLEDALDFGAAAAYLEGGFSRELLGRSTFDPATGRILTTEKPRGPLNRYLYGAECDTMPMVAAKAR